MINRTNILELIGKHKGKYHSCILTCYSLDFSFFEERVLPTLRLAKIKNVNIIADGHCLEIAQEHTTGREFQHNKTYNFQPVYQEHGVFHPKIMLLTGLTHGLLIIGSGNITSSGLSSNDEIWGAFHLNNLENENTPLFGSVWRYLESFTDKSLGFVSQKIEWMKKYSPWLADLPSQNDWVSLNSPSIKVKFMSNKKGNYIFKDLTSNIPKNNIEELTVISPYFDKKGSLLNELQASFKPKQFKCLIDANSSILPIEIVQEPPNGIKFYNWEDCIRNFDSTYNRLHAKAIYFRSSNEEFLLLGSANATMAGMGGNSFSAKNAEAGVLLKRHIQKESWLEELGIDTVDVSPIELPSRQTHFFDKNDSPKTRLKYKILYSELRVNEITIYLDKQLQEDVEVTCLNRMEQPIEVSIIKIDKETLIVQVAHTDDVFKVMLGSISQRISNYSIIHRLESLLRCNPDPNQEKLDFALNQDFVDGEGVTDLLKFMDYDWADDNSSENIQMSHGSSSIRSISETEDVKEYQVLSEQEFNKIGDAALIVQSEELSNPTVKIADFLNIYASGALMKEDDFDESEEQKLFEDQEQIGAGKEVQNIKKIHQRGSKEKKAMMQYFNKLHNIYSKRIALLLKSKLIFKSKEIQQPPKAHTITIRSVSSILIAVHLLQIKYGKKFIVTIEGLEETEDPISKEEHYITLGKLDENANSLKGFLLNVMGKFWLASTVGYHNYDIDVVQQKLARSRLQLLIKSTCLILNTSWNPKEEKHRDLLLLNGLYFSIGKSLLESDVQSEILQKINNYEEWSGFVSSEFRKQRECFFQKLWPSYLIWLGKFENDATREKSLIKPTSQLKPNSIIFSSKIGFNMVEKVKLYKSGYKLDLSRPGYRFTNGDFIMKEVQFGTKLISF